MSSADSVPSTPDPINPLSLLDEPLAENPTYYEVQSLARELCEAEGYTLANAIRVAADDLGYYLDYVAPHWDRYAFAAGNDDAMPF